MQKHEFSSTITTSISKAASDSFADSIIMIDIDNLVPSPDNFFEVGNVKELAETILGQNGVKENLMVKKLEVNKYEIISGHRRTAAVRYLLEKGENISRFLPCLVQNYESEDDKKLDIILMNVSARILTDAQKWRSFEIISEIIQKKKKYGDRFGRVRDALAEILGVSNGQIARMQTIDKRASSEVKDALVTGQISINKAEALSRLEATEQNSAISKSVKDIKDCVNVDTSDTEKSAENCVNADDIDNNDDALKCVNIDSFKSESDIQKTIMEPAKIREFVSAMQHCTDYKSLKKVCDDLTNYLNNCA